MLPLFVGSSILSVRGDRITDVPHSSEEVVEGFRWEKDIVAAALLQANREKREYLPVPVKDEYQKTDFCTCRESSRTQTGGVLHSENE